MLREDCSTPFAAVPCNNKRQWEVMAHDEIYRGACDHHLAEAIRRAMSYCGCNKIVVRVAEYLTK